MTQFNINVGNDFTTRPMGRYSTDGNSSGEGFYTNHLIPKLKELMEYNKQNPNDRQKLILDFGTVKMCGGSWIEEAFGGAIRNSDIRPVELFDLIEVKVNGRQYLADIAKSVYEAIQDEQLRQRTASLLKQTTHGK